MKIHIVQKGDTLWEIAKKYGVDFEELKELNSQLSTPDMIMPGMKIKIPNSSKPVKKEQMKAKKQMSHQPIEKIKEDDKKKSTELKPAMPIQPYPMYPTMHLPELEQSYPTMPLPEMPQHTLPKVEKKEKPKKEHPKKEVPKEKIPKHEKPMPQPAPEPMPYQPHVQPMPMGPCYCHCNRPPCCYSCPQMMHQHKHHQCGCSSHQHHVMPFVAPCGSMPMGMPEQMAMNEWQGPNQAAMPMAMPIQQMPMPQQFENYPMAPYDYSMMRDPNEHIDSNLHPYDHSEQREPATNNPKPYPPEMTNFYPIPPHHPSFLDEEQSEEKEDSEA